MLIKYDNSKRKICADIFYDVYKSPPFSYEWLKVEDICRYFENIENTPNFYGFLYTIKNQIIGICFGIISDYFSASKYYINEIYVKREFQNKGVGNKMLLEIEKFLLQNNIVAIELKTSKNSNSFIFYTNNGYEISKETVSMLKMLR